MLSRADVAGSYKSYRFGFNGKMNDNDVKGGLGNQQDYGMRIYDGRVGRFLSVDPITKMYPELSPYQFSGNSPVQNIDLDGMEPLWSMNDYNQAMKQTAYAIWGPEKGERQYQISRKGQAVGAILGLIGPADIYITKGKVSTFIMGTVLAGAAGHNREKTPEGRARQEKASRAAVADVIIGFGIGQFISKGLKAGQLLYQEAKGIIAVGGPTVDPIAAGKGVTSVNSKVTSANSYQGMEFLDDQIRYGSTRHIPKTPLQQQRVNDVDIPLPDPLAKGFPHTTLGGKLSNDGTFYRQSATFPGSNISQVNGFEVPWGRVDWYDHGRPWDHFDTHIHEFYYDFKLKRWNFPTGGEKPFPYQLKLNYNK